MNLSMFDLVRVWAMLTGLALAIWFFAALYLGYAPSPLLPMLVTGIGGFELYQFALDMWARRRRSRG